MSALRKDYTQRYGKYLIPLAERLEILLSDYLKGVPRVDRISARPKEVERFLEKADKTEDDGAKKYDDPLNQIQDQVGARIVTFYLDDVDVVAKTVEKYFREIEQKTVVPDSDSEFGYFGKHYILLFPRDIIASGDQNSPLFFELQIKTLFQHAWSEANHDLGYKPEAELSPIFKRKIAFTSAQAWGADQIFDELQKEKKGN